MSKKYTISDIALLAGVSKGTVDRVIHNRGKVSPVAYEKVTKVLEGIDYQPNLIARNLKKNKKYRIAVVFPDPDIDAYWSTCLDGIRTIYNELRAFGLEIESFFFDPKNSNTFSNIHQQVLKTSPDAVLMAPLFQKQSIHILEKYRAQHILVATFNNRITSKNNKSFIGQNLQQSGRVAAKLLDSCTPETGVIAVVHIDEKYKQALYIQEKELGFRTFFTEKPAQNRAIITLKLRRDYFESQLKEFLKTHQNLVAIFVTTSKSYEIIPIIQRYATQKIAIVGYDLLNENIRYLKEDEINFLIHQNPKQQVYLGIKGLAEHLLFDKEINEEILLPIDIINSENVDLFTKPS